MGPVSSREGVGCGFIHKTKYRVDHMNIQWPRYVLALVIRGSGSYTDENGVEYKLKAGDFFQRIPGRVHSNFVDVDSGYFEYFHECGSMFYQALRSMQIIRSETPVQSMTVDEVFLDRIWNFYTGLKNANEEDLAGYTGEFISILEQCHRRSVPDTTDSDFGNIMELACRKLGSDFDREFDIKKFCRQNGWGYEHFRKVFRHRVGISPWQYRVRRRLDRACSMLTEERRSISDVASRLGYSSVYEFSAQFKKYIGISPQYYRDGRRS